MHTKTLLKLLTASLGSSAVSYQLGKNHGIRSALDEKTWAKMTPEDASAHLLCALRHGNWQGLETSDARNTISNHLDACRVPDGDLAVPSLHAHSRRHVVSQWQRVAAGASVMVLGTDRNGDTCVALGSQRGHLVHPQGYMEAPLPKTDLTGLGKFGVSRLNGKTNRSVPEDDNLEANAIREVKEELGIEIDKKDLKLLGVNSGPNANTEVPTVAASYAVKLPNLPPLEVLDNEFAEDDLTQPFWEKIQNIECQGDVCKTSQSDLKMHPNTVKAFRECLRLFGLRHSNQTPASIQLTSQSPVVKN